MNYFYATRHNKDGNKLVTSYEKQQQATKYGGPTAVITKEVFYLGKDGKARKDNDDETGLILRSKLDMPGAGNSSNGNFVLYAVVGDQYEPTHFRYDTYGNANNAMKALAPSLGSLAVVEETDPSVDVEAEREMQHAEELASPF